MDLVLLWGVLNSYEEVCLFVTTLLDLTNADAKDEDFFGDESRLLFFSMLETDKIFDEWTELCG